MNKISDQQLYCMLILLLLPVAFLEQPHRLINVAYNNAWLTFVPVFLTGALLVKIYEVIIKKSREPFPVLLDEHLGKICGRILGSVYILVFIITCAFNLRIFLEFMKMMVLPLTPVSIFIGVILLTGFMAIKNGLTSIARLSELDTLLGLPIIVLLILICLLSRFHPEGLHPIGYINIKSYGEGVFFATMIVGKMMPVLSLAFFMGDKQRSTRVMYLSLLTYIFVQTFVAFAIIVSMGTYPALNYVFPTFNMIRLAQIGAFLQNLDILAVAVLIAGIMGAVLISWWMACFTTEKVFGLQEHRFLAAPTSLIIGVLALIISKNNLGVVIWSLDIIPWIFSIFFILIPLLVCIICLFKPDVSTPEPANPAERLHKQEVSG